MRSLYGYPVPDGIEMKWERWHEYTDDCTGNLIMRYDIRLEGVGKDPKPFTLGLAVTVTQESVIEEPHSVSLCRSWLMHEIAAPNIPERKQGCSPTFTAPTPEFNPAR